LIWWFADFSMAALLSWDDGLLKGEGMKRTFGWGMTAVVTGAFVAGLAGCRPSDAVKQSGGYGAGSSSAEKTAAPVTAAAPSTPLDPATLGGLAGTIHFSGKAPERVKIDMSMDPVCSMTTGENDAEQYAVKGGGLGNVYVYVKSGPAAAMSYVPPVPAPVVLDQVGCRYTPHVIALMKGGSVEFRNSDNTMHNIHTLPMEGEEGIDISQGPKGTPQVKQFAKPEVMMPVRCNNHPWMNAFINVSATPFFAVSDSEGKFEIRGLPAGTYTLAAVHEKLGEQTVTVTVDPKKPGKADFSFSMK
jgi:plastocyanin